MDSATLKNKLTNSINWCKQHRRLAVRLLILTTIFVVAFYGMCVFLSYKAAEIFNKTVAERELFPGTVTVERLSATPLGQVSFEELKWKDENGNLMVDIPDGSFRVNPWDVVWRRIGTTTVTDLTIDQAYIHLVFNEDMELQNVKKLLNKNDTGKKDKTKKDKTLQITGLKGNKKFICHVTINDSTIEAEAPGRHFTINQVNLKSDINTGGMTKFDLSAGQFTGTVDAEGLTLGGSINFAKDIPEYDLALVIKNCNPKSLDVGLDIDDKASAYADITGSLPRPVIEGTLTMDKLDITALNFTNLKGKFHYEGGKLDAKDVTASIFGGSVEASGHFDLDGKSYQADLKGQRLKGGVAAHDLFLRCSVTLDLHMGEDKKLGTKEIYGTFYSGPGRYHILSFKKISGSFEQDGKTLLFKDVLISMAMGDVTTDAFSIVNGKVHLGPIYLEKEGTRSKFL